MLHERRRGQRTIKFTGIRPRSEPGNAMPLSRSSTCAGSLAGPPHTQLHSRYKLCARSRVHSKMPSRGSGAQSFFPKVQATVSWPYPKRAGVSRLAKILKVDMGELFVGRAHKL